MICEMNELQYKHMALLTFWRIVISEITEADKSITFGKISGLIDNRLDQSRLQPRWSV